MSGGLRLVLFGSILDIIFWVLRIAVGVGGFILGWFFTPMVVNFFYRLAFHKPLPGWTKPLCRLLGGLLVGFLCFYYVPLGGGGGLGWGTGPGGGAGRGPGQGGDGVGVKQKSVGTGKGSDKVEPAKDKDYVPDKKKKDPGITKTTRQEIDIEMLGGPRYKQDGKYYLWLRKDPALSLDEVEDKLKRIKGPAEVTVLFTLDSVGELHDAVGKLLRLTTKYEIPTLKRTEKEESPKK